MKSNLIERIKGYGQGIVAGQVVLPDARRAKLCAAADSPAHEIKLQYSNPKRIDSGVWNLNFGI